MAFDWRTIKPAELGAAPPFARLRSEGTKENEASRSAAEVRRGKTRAEAPIDRLISWSTTEARGKNHTEDRIFRPI